MLILALEASTSSAKAMLYDTTTGKAETASEAYDRSICADGLTDTEQVFLCVARLGRSLAAGKPIAAVATVSTWHSIDICDQNMIPKMRTINWNYMAPSDMCRRVRADKALAHALYSRTGCMPHVTYMRDALRYLGSNGVDLKDTKLVTQGGYNFYRLTGELRETRCAMSGTGFINLNALDYDDFAMEYCGVGKEQFGPLCDYRDVLPLSRAGAELLGIDAGVPVVPAHADGAMNQVGDGAAARGRMTVSVGTSGAVRYTSDRPTMPESHALWCYYGAADYMAGAAVAGACNCVNWFKDTCMKGAYGFEALESGAALPDDLPVFLPFVFGERCPGWQDDRLGGFTELRPEHNLSDMYLAVQQGVLFNMYQCYEELVRNMGEPQRICLSGGIQNSARWTQMAADIFGQEMLISQNANASLMGAVVLGLHAAGAIDDVRTFEFPSARELERVTPDAARHDRLMAQYARYLDQYRRSSR